MTEIIKTKQLQQVIDYKMNFVRKIKDHEDHSERKYLRFFIEENKKQAKEEKEFVDFLRIYKHEWRHYYEDQFPSKTLKQAGRKF